MSENPISILVSRRFLPLFITQFFGAFNDNLFRQAILILITFGMAETFSTSVGVMNNLAVGLFILPFFLFSALAGQLADKYEKTGQIFWIKVWEIGLMIAGAIGFYLSSLPVLIVVLTGLGLQSTFFGPIKYSILPDLLAKKDLLFANAMIEAGTFLAILLGTLVGGFVMATENGHSAIAAVTISIAVLGTLSGRMVPKTGQAAPDIKITANIFASTKAQMQKAWACNISRRSIIGISWIWMYGSLYISQMPVIIKSHLGGDESVVTLSMACFALGIAIGSFLCNRLLKGLISSRLASPTFIVMLCLGVLLYVLVPAEASNIGALSALAFIQLPLNDLIMALLLTTAICAGIVIVPLYAVLQDKTDRSERSRIIAATNICNSGFMAGGAIIAALLVSFGASTSFIFLLIAVGNIAMITITNRLSSDLKTASKQ
ncbi:MFS transporter [Kordiimonas pumila]|uniref:MFS transporter n=1 Tax=Kordiimonas pumila TaxID=2161677 RepID=A0ABV7D0F2_9PROT|nr:MFS transporter [Kordiimonas pumila]